MLVRKATASSRGVRSSRSGAEASRTSSGMQLRTDLGRSERSVSASVPPSTRRDPNRDTCGRGYPVVASTCLTGRCEASSVQIISGFSEAGYLLRRPPHPRSCFFERTGLQGRLGHDLFRSGRFRPQILHLGGCRPTDEPARPPGMPSTMNDKDSRRSPRDSRAQQCPPHRANRPGQPWPSLRPQSVCAPSGRYP